MDGQNMRVFPILENPEEELNNLKERSFEFSSIPQDNQLVPPGVGDLVPRSEVVNLRNIIISIASQYGFPDISFNPKKDMAFDKDVGKVLYEEMNITPSVAATLSMWCFLNIAVVPDVVSWRFAKSSNYNDHFISVRRNYLGTQWWRYYLFVAQPHATPQSERMYLDMTDREIADIYERTSSAGIPGHLPEIVQWFNEFAIDSNIEDPAPVYRETLKRYTGELGNKLFFALSSADRKKIFSACFDKAKRDVPKS